jgi:dephospho-CoA kinase
MIKIGLTGNIASGKSFVEDIFKNENISCLDSDKITHDLLENDFEVIEKIKKVFLENGFDILDKNKKISRNKLGAIVFKDREKLKILESIIHPVIKKQINSFFKDNSEQKLAVAVVPLVFEANMADMFDKIVLVAVDKDIQLERLIKRNNFTQEEALLRIDSQIPQEEKIKKVDFVLWNNASQEELTSITKELIKNLINN